MVGRCVVFGKGVFEVLGYRVVWFAMEESGGLQINIGVRGKVGLFSLRGVAGVINRESKLEVVVK